jgi:adenylosuccinate synthase
MSGIAPVYGDKFMKKGIQAGELFYPEYLQEHLADIVAYTNLRIQGIYGEQALDFTQIYNWLLHWGEQIKPYIKNIQPLITQMLNDNKQILVEAQLGALRDITHGIYPFTTSSSTLSGYACASIPVPPQQMEEVIGITKAYSTCVGEGAFVTEIHDALADEIRVKGKEFGAKTGRPRRIGYFDAVATRYGCRLQNATSMVVTCLDVLSGLKELKICTHDEVNGEQTGHFLLNPALIKAVPVYETLPGWDEDLTGVRSFADLPLNAQNYVQRIEELCGLPITSISVGPEREALIVR